MDPYELELLQKWRSGAYAPGFRPYPRPAAAAASGGGAAAAAPNRMIAGNPIEVDQHGKKSAGPFVGPCRRV